MRMGVDRNKNRVLFWNLTSSMFGLIYGVWGHFQEYFSYILAISFIGGGNRSTQRKPSTWRKQTKSSYAQNYIL
jgi:hypothetical protein